MELYKRESYLKKIRGFYNDTDLIKVITGVRRCGKSSLMQMIADELREKGVKEENLIFIKLDDKKYKNVTTPDDLEKLIDELNVSSDTKYLFIDEIQNIEGFEKLINAYRESDEYSIFITGSNSYLLSGELITKLTGRYLEFEMMPLNFEEYIEMKKFYNMEVNPNLTKELDLFIEEGGFPKAIFYENKEDKRTYVKGIIQEIFEKDIKRRVKIRNLASFEQVQTYIINSYGTQTSLANILDDLNKNGLSIKRETLKKYIQILIDSKIISECKRFDLKSRRSIGSEEKYYLTDLSFYFSTNTDNRINYGPALENIVYCYAKSKGYAISIGRIGSLECDFILRDIENNYSYVQVAMTIMDSIKTENREYRPLETIRDNYPKFVLTRDDFIQKRNGIIHRNIPEFFSKGELFK